ncbi:MAG TPA: peptidylprolyl isomerase [Pyrinomonadaceae bacterium]|nr:peptidylprolyl isomerase [Pyrinomonadaceae bacterium]
MSERHTSSVAARTRRALFVALCFLSASCAGRAPSASGGSVVANDSSLPPVVAVVDGREIPTRLYEMYLKNGRESLGIDETAEEGRRKLELLREGVVSDLIDRALVAAEAGRRGLSITPAALAEAERREVTLIGGEEKFKSYLADHGITREEFLEEVVKSPLYGELLRAELAKGLSVSDTEVKTFYDAHKTEEVFRMPERVAASHLLIDARRNLIAQQIQSEKNLSGEALSAAVSAEMRRRRARAEELRRRAATKGADFAALAREFSEDVGTRDAGGDLGNFGRDSHPRAFDDAAFALKPGETSGVVETDYGFHIIKAKSHDAARTLTLEEAAPEIRRRLLVAREGETLRNWLKDARRKAKVKINEPFRFGALKNEFPAV